MKPLNPFFCGHAAALLAGHTTPLRLLRWSNIVTALQARHDFVRLNECDDFAWSRRLWRGAARRTFAIAVSP